MAPALGDLYNKVKTHLAHTYLTILPGPYQYVASLTMPTAVLLSVFGGTFGHEAVLTLCGYLPMPQTVEMVPMARTIQQLYKDNPHVFHVLIDTTFSLAAVAYTFLAMPAIDLLLGDDPRNLTDEEVEAAAKEPAYRRVLYACVGAHWLSLLAGCVLISSHDVHPLVLTGMALSAGMEGGLMFTMAHELVHSRHPAEKAAAGALLGTAAYMHWHNSHLAHHRKVATREDPASARLGESLYSFIPRSIVGNLQDGIWAEQSRLQSHNLPFCSLHNRMLLWTATPLGLMAGVYCLWGPKALAFGVAQGLIAVLLLETVNYVEHYGLERQRLPNGRYERVETKHSWNANFLFTNSVLFQLQRHSDHHAHANKHYQALESVPEAPQLPANYPVMMLLALLPGAWFHIMDQRALATNPRLQPSPTEQPE